MLYPSHWLLLPLIDVGTCRNFLYDNISSHSVDVGSIVSLFFALAGFQKIVPKLGKERKLLLEKKSFGVEHEHSDNFDLGAWFWCCTCLRKLHFVVVVVVVWYKPSKDSKC